MADAPRAQDPLKDLCEEASCPICLDYFKDPVTLECGHNFCRACLSQTWEKPDNTETSCPHCREIISQKNLRTNQSLVNFVEITKKLSLQGPKKKTKGEERVCEKHQEPLSLFCRDDETFICVMCNTSKEHFDHRRIPLGMAAQEYKVLMSHRQDELVKKRENILVYKAETEKEAQDLLKQTKTEMETTLLEMTEIRQFLEEQENHLRAQMEDLEKQIVRKRDEHLVSLSWEQSSLESLIQETKEKCQQPPAELLQDARNLLQRCDEKQTSEKPVAFSPELKWKIWEFCDLNSDLVAAMKPFRAALVPGPKLQKANVTLDPDTASCKLSLSEDQKSVRIMEHHPSTYKLPFFRSRSVYRQSVRHGAKTQDLTDNPERIIPGAYVFGHKGLTSGRHFWEVVVGGKGDWAVGVARTSVGRKGFVDIAPEEGIWAVGNWRGMYPASSCPYSLNEKTKRVRVCLNKASNQVAFYDADTGDRICVFPDVPFSEEQVLPFFYISGNGNLRISS